MPSRPVAEQTARTPAPRGPESSAKLRLISLCLGFFMVTMDATVVNTALPSIGHAWGVAVNGLQWVTAGYTVAFACLLLSAGSLGDRLGPARCSWPVWPCSP